MASSFFFFNFFFSKFSSSQIWRCVRKQKPTFISIKSLLSFSGTGKSLEGQNGKKNTLLSSGNPSSERVFLWFCRWRRSVLLSRRRRRRRRILLLVPHGFHGSWKRAAFLHCLVCLYLFFPTLLATKWDIPSVHEDVSVSAKGFLAKEAGIEEVRGIDKRLVESGIEDPGRNRSGWRRAGGVWIERGEISEASSPARRERGRRRVAASGSGDE